MNAPTCDLCRKKIRTWNPFNKAVRVVLRLKDNVWVEYYHIKCLIKAGMIRKVNKEKAGRWDDKEGTNTTLSVK